MARKGDGLYQRGSVWYLDCRLNGQRYVTKLGRNIKRNTAAALADVKRAAFLKGEAGIRKKKDVAFDKAKQAFLDWVTINKRPRTVRVYTQQLTRLADSFSGKTLAQISSFDVERHKRTRVEQGARVVVNRELAVLKNLINKAKAWKLYEGENPVLGVKFLEEPKRRLRYLEPEEEAKLLAVAGEPLGSLIIVGINTGLRIAAEALTLRWSDVDLSRSLLTVQAAYSKNGETRNIPLNSRAKATLQQLHRSRRSDFVFSQPNGKPYKGMDKLFTEACDTAGLKATGISLHTLRHTFASRLVMAGVDLVTVQQYGGWSDLSLVQRYAHLSPTHTAKAIERIAQTFHDAFHNNAKTEKISHLAEQHATM